MMNVQQALRRELGTRGFDVADDTVASRGEIYVKGDGDLGAGLFEFKHTVVEAMDSMYQGHWTEGLPPRFAVLPSEASKDAHFELLEQARIIPLLYEVEGDEVSFIELDAAVARLGTQHRQAAMRMVVTSWRMSRGLCGSDAFHLTPSARCAC